MEYLVCRFAESDSYIGQCHCFQRLTAVQPGAVSNSEID